MNRRRLLRRLQPGHLNNIRYADFVDLARGFGFEHDQTTGSHEVHRHPVHKIKLVLQPERGEAKPYQARQLLTYVKQFDLELSD